MPGGRPADDRVSGGRSVCVRHGLHPGVPRARVYVPPESSIEAKRSGVSRSIVEFGGAPARSARAAPDCRAGDPRPRARNGARLVTGGPWTAPQTSTYVRTRRKPYGVSGGFYRWLAGVPAPLAGGVPGREAGLLGKNRCVLKSICAQPARWAATLCRSRCRQWFGWAFAGVRWMAGCSRSTGSVGRSLIRKETTPC